MNEEKLNGSTTLEDENQPSKDGRKRISYVGKDLKTIIDFVAKVYNKLGHTEYHSNKAIATVNGLSPDSIKMHLSSAQQYKLLEIKHRIGYKVTDHFQKIHLPKNDNERRIAIIESLKNAETYQQLFKDYEYHVVPSDGVRNYFIRTYGMKEDSAIKAADVFLQNLKDFDLLDSRGVLTSALPTKPIIPELQHESEETSDMDTPPVEENNGGNGGQKNSPPAIVQNEYTQSTKYQDHIWIPIHLTKQQTAVFAYPKGISENDIKIVEHQLAGILLRIRLENEENNKGA